MLDYDTRYLLMRLCKQQHRDVMFCPLGQVLKKTVNKTDHSDVTREVNLHNTLTHPVQRRRCVKMRQNASVTSAGGAKCVTFQDMASAYVILRARKNAELRGVGLKNRCAHCDVTGPLPTWLDWRGTLRNSVARMIRLMERPTPFISHEQLLRFLDGMRSMYLYVEYQRCAMASHIGLQVLCYTYWETITFKLLIDVEYV